MRRPRTFSTRSKARPIRRPILPEPYWRGNISEKLDFTLGYDVGYNVASNKVRKESNNRYSNQQVSGNFKWITWAGITLQANGSYLKYSGITDSFVEDYFLLNASIGKKIFKHQRGEINVSAYDLLNQNKSFSRNVTATYIENVKTNVLGRYFSINLIYNLRRFGGKNVDASSTRRGKLRIRFTTDGH
ncbi:MAG: outer membrane beta-barrel protein [Alistipes indistinctus]